MVSAIISTIPSQVAKFITITARGEMAAGKDYSIASSKVKQPETIDE
jgi:hypothetical protein